MPDLSSPCPSDPDFSTDPNRNARWARLIAEEARRGGINHAVLCPGSRNSPLVFALAAVFGERAIGHVDERSAAFLALGLIRATGQGALVCVTSGSALANCLPALTEADAAGLPLLIISGDRPWELNRCGAPQAMPQRGILSAFVRSDLALGEPDDAPASLRALRTQVSRLVQTARRDRGPVHLNVPLRDPLPPLPDLAWQAAVAPIPADILNGRAHDAPWVQVQAARAIPEVTPVGLRPGLKGLILVGCLDQRDLPATAALAGLGYPVVADGPSQARHAGYGVVTTADALVLGRARDWRPDVVLQLGAAPLTRGLNEWLGRLDAPRWLVGGAAHDRDPTAAVTGHLAGPVDGILTRLAGEGRLGDGAWLRQWQFAEAAAETAWLQWYTQAPWDEDLATALAVNHRGFAFLHLASSMSVRLANLHLRSGPARPVHSNRGVNGIDGTLGTFLGLCAGHTAAGDPTSQGGKGLLLTGDLAFLHDLPALAAAGLAKAGGAIVLLNNGGGGIFDFLPVAQVPGAERWIRTTHDLRFADSARQFGLMYHAVTDRAGLAAALDAAATGSGLHLIECDLRGLDHVSAHRELLRQMAGNSPASGA